MGQQTEPSAAPLVLHYHLFKNAGTSVDAMLQSNFGDRWAEAEFDGPDETGSNVAAVEAWLKARPELDAFSSHTALFPVPDLDGRPVFPIIFVRHPIDRLMSAYSFERKQAQETEGSRLARDNDFAGYVQILLDQLQNRQAHNFHAFRLAGVLPPQEGSERERALAALNVLPFIGLVEAYDRSLERLETLLAPRIDGFASMVVRKNVTNESGDALSEKLARIAWDLGPELYGELCDANSTDLEIFARVSATYA